MISPSASVRVIFIYIGIAWSELVTIEYMILKWSRLCECFYVRWILFRVPHTWDYGDGDGLCVDYIKVNHETWEKTDVGCS
jgi:hypothetical protein